MQKIANPQQNQGVQRFFCFVTVKDGILIQDNLLFFSLQGGCFLIHQFF